MPFIHDPKDIVINYLSWRGNLILVELHKKTPKANNTYITIEVKDVIKTNAKKLQHTTTFLKTVMIQAHNRSRQLYLPFFHLVNIKTGANLIYKAGKKSNLFLHQKIRKYFIKHKQNKLENYPETSY